MPDEREVIRPSAASDIPLLSSLFFEVFGQQRDEQLWRWKYFENPARGAGYVCEAEGRIVAHCGGTPVVFRDGPRRYRAFQSVDFMSSPSYPGGAGRGGVFVRTANAFFEHFCGPETAPLVYGFPGERHRLLGERILGYRPVEKVNEWSIEASESDPEELPPVAAGELHRFSLPVELGADRSESYLRWRYVDHPTKRYRMVIMSRPLVGFRNGAIVSIEEDAVRIMELAGKITGPNLARLLAPLRRFGRPVLFWCSERAAIAEALREAGFRAELRDHFIEWRTFFDRPLPRPGELYYTFGDYDVY